MERMQSNIKIMIAEDQSIILHALVTLLETVDGFTIIGAARNGVELLRQLEKNKPDIVLMDIKMPKMNGFEATRKIDEKMPWVKVIALSMYDHPVFVKEMLKNGARGFLSKNCTLEELCEAIRSVYSGKTFLSSSVQQIVLNDFTFSPGEHDQDDIKSLTSREIQIIQQLADGSPTREIAQRLFISDKTVERHKTNILKKLRVRNTAQLIRVAVEKGILINGNN